MKRRARARVAATGLLLALSVALHAAAPAPASHIWHNARIHTGAPAPSEAGAIAVRDGRILAVGDAPEILALAGPDTVVEDLGGRFVMPGLVDAHMHPLAAGRDLLACNLQYAELTVEGLQAGVRACLADPAHGSGDDWLEVVGWFQEGMVPAGTRTSKADIDPLDPRRPIIVRSSFGHTVLANSRALARGGIDARTPEPADGKIWRDARGEPTGLLEDGAFAVFSRLVPAPTPAEDEQAARESLRAMAAKGITAFLDAAADDATISAYARLAARGELTARAHFAVAVDPAEAADPAAAVGRVAALAKRHDGGSPQPAPGITVRHAKLFMDGVIAAPALTGAVLEPYRENAGTREAPRWVPGSSRGPEPYFPPEALAAILTGLAREGISPHLHADGDRAVRVALDAVAAMRAAAPGSPVRAALAHAEIVSPTDYGRFAALEAIAVLSLQWGKPAGDTLGLTGHFGPERMAIIEPAGLLAAAGAPIAMGSDWPVDALDPWFALKVGVTRQNRPDAGPAFRGRLGEDPGLSAEAALRAATLGAARVLHLEDSTGALVPGRFADLIVLDRDPLTIPPESIADVRVLRTVVGGRVVHEDPAIKNVARAP